MAAQDAERRELGGAPPAKRRSRPNTRLAALQRLGIDIWVRRQAVSPSALASVHVPTPTPAVERPARQKPAVPVPPAPARLARTAAPPPQPDVAAPVDPFRIRCFRYGRVFAAIAEDAWPLRRLLLDVALALNDFQPAERAGVEFRWPLPGPAPMQPSTPDAPARAFRAFFGHQSRNSERTLIAGAQVAELLGRLVPTEAGLVGDHLYIPSEKLDTSAKKALWQLIRDA